MGRKVTKKKKVGTAGEEDLAVLLPQQVLVIDGRSVVPHEITLHESLVHRDLLNPLITALRDVAAGDDRGISNVDALLDVLAANTAATEQLVAMSCAQPVEWVQGLKSDEGEALLFAWWVVNAGFFIRQVMRPIIQARMLQAGLTSSPPSSPTGTTPNDSLTTPAAS